LVDESEESGEEDMISCGMGQCTMLKKDFEITGKGRKVEDTIGDAVADEENEENEERTASQMADGKMLRASILIGSTA
jgi:hypothetical protein